MIDLLKPKRFAAKQFLREAQRAIVRDDIREVKQRDATEYSLGVRIDPVTVTINDTTGHEDTITGSYVITVFDRAGATLERVLV